MGDHDGDQPLNFSPGPCARHRRMFVSLLRDHGLRDWVDMERVRMRVVAEAGRTFPADKIRAWLTTRCVACDEEAWVINTTLKIALEEAALLDLEKRLGR
jgi:hypothetical protein